MTGADGSRVRDSYRLITTLMDHRRFPAATVVRLYHERWEIESAYFALRHTLLGGHVLRSGDRPGLEQETWALLTLYQLLRMAMVTAIETRPGTDPDRDSFTTAMEAAKDQLTAAAGFCPDGPADLPGAIGRAVLATLLPARRPRYSARKVKCATSRYLNPRRRPPGPSHRHHRDRHRHLHPACRPEARPDLPRPQHTRRPRRPRPPTCSAPFFLSTWKRVGVVRHEHAGPGLTAGVRFRARRHCEHEAARCRSRDHGRGRMVVMMSFPGG